jgi:hypothetical protein
VRHFAREGLRFPRRLTTGRGPGSGIHPAGTAGLNLAQSRYATAFVYGHAPRGRSPAAAGSPPLGRTAALPNAHRATSRGRVRDESGDACTNANGWAGSPMQPPARARRTKGWRSAPLRPPSATASATGTRLRATPGVALAQPSCQTIPAQVSMTVAQGVLDASTPQLDVAPKSR